MHDSYLRTRLRRLLSIIGRAESTEPARRLSGPRVEELEWRMAPAAPVALSINRTAPALPNTNGVSVQYTLAFDQPVTGVDAADFKVATTNNLVAMNPVVVTGSGAAYTVVINGIHGSGALRLDLIDNDSITAGGLALGGPGVGNGSFQGQSYTVLQPFPSVLSINRTTPAATTTDASSVVFTVTFSSGVTGVDPSDFALVKTGTVAAAPPQVTPVSTSVYAVTISGITGDGMLGLNLVDNGSIRDLAGNPLVAASAPAAFAVQSTFAAGRYSPAVALGDVNGDGKPDLAVAEYGNAAVGVLLGNGDGSFQARQTFAAGAYPKSVALGDVNGDGKPDVAVANFFDDAVSLLLGNGNGSFQAPKSFATGAGPLLLAMGDVNGDGKPDLAVTSYNGDSVSVLLGNGDGSFQARRNVASGGSPKSLALGDVNGDGKQDLVASNYANNTVSVLLGNGNGSFQARMTFATGEAPYSVALGDVNGDGKQDLAVSNYIGNSLSVLLGNGDGKFQPQKTFASGVLPEHVALADVNGDGKPDLAVANYDSKSVSVLLGNGNGSFQTQQTFATGSFPKLVALGDMNGDAKLDLAIANFTDDAVSVLLANGNGDFTGQTYAIDHAVANTTTTLTATPNASTGGQLVTFTATIAPSPGALGTVTFKDNGTALSGGSNIAIANGAATFQISTLAVGTHPITADYSGATGFAGSTSNTVSFVVSASSSSPQVQSVTLNGNIASLAGNQHSRIASIVVAFDQTVLLDPNALTLALHTNNVIFNAVPQVGGFGSLPASLNLATSDNKTWIVTFTGNTEGGADGFNSLKDGVYDFNVDATKVHPLGVPSVSMANNSTTTFHRLFGDTGNPTTPADGTPNVDFEAIVNSGDNLTFRGAFNNPNTYKAFLDVNGDGVINSGDNLQFRTRFNKGLTWRV